MSETETAIKPAPLPAPPPRTRGPGLGARLSRLLGALFTYAFLIVAGALLAVLCSYLMRQFGY